MQTYIYSASTFRLLLLLLLIVPASLWAQQQPLFTQYMFNGLAINPAYAGSHESMSITALARKQWLGMEGAPSTQTFALHTPVPNEKIGLGLLLTHDQAGPVHQYNIKFAYAYRLPLGPGKLAMGIQAGLLNYNARFSTLYLGPNVQDPTFEQDINKTLFDVGTGLYYSTDRFYLGLAVPQMLALQSEQHIHLSRHYFLNSGYVVALNRSLQLKPNVLVKAVAGAPLELDLNANLLINEVLWIGASYRSFQTLSALLELQLTDQLRVGYAYDFPASSELGRHTSSSHELMLNYRFTFYKSNISTPRNF
ncbi:PorP/SprF family type IX secretion system membrane protein [Cesiribacter andamanensis]|uniref:Bacteroidetes-specific putative membrane protein n=1 Tax=Cesiribacter andamanensis AMV16 TaxID=1279009 RepID=M7N2S1_9BACT|nr:type IX secretion system membrane protein PorP/SprF [Cesiribacter andamanensis]EMR01516.1 Bacteroidetes-specific putative membrane protein [Cesiribacter andamanensis AMV16]